MNGMRGPTGQMKPLRSATSGVVRGEETTQDKLVAQGTHSDPEDTFTYKGEDSDPTGGMANLARGKFGVPKVCQETGISGAFKRWRAGMNHDDCLIHHWNRRKFGQY